MTNVINFPEPSQERPRKFRNPDFAEPLMSRKSKREIVCLRTLQSILAEAPDEIRRMEAGVSAHEQLARPALQELVAPPEVNDFPNTSPVETGEVVVADTVQSYDNVAFLTDARARVDEHYQDGTAASSQEGGTVTEMTTYLDQHPRVSPEPAAYQQQQPPMSIYPSVETTADPANYYSQSNVYQLTPPQQGNPLFQNPNVQTDPMDDNLRAIGYGEVQNVAA